MKMINTILFVLFFALCSYSQTASVISENANLRGTPNQSGKVVDTLPAGTSLQVLQQKGVWFLVQSANYVGWIHGDTIEYIGGGDNNTKPLLAPIVVPTTRRTTTRTSPVVRTSTPRSSSGGYIRGPRGGCFYYTASGRKQYVDRSLCN